MQASIEYIHNQIIQKRDEGTGVLLVSSELDEILALSDRIAVMCRGRLSDARNVEDWDEHQLMVTATGQDQGNP